MVAFSLSREHHKWVRETLGIDPTTYFDGTTADLKPSLAPSPDSAGSNQSDVGAGGASGGPPDGSGGARGSSGGTGDGPPDPRLQRMLDLTEQKVGKRLPAEAVQLLVGFGTGWAIAQLTPGGWIADAVILGVAALTISKGLSDAIDDVRACVRLLDDPNGDLDSAADHLANAILTVGEAMFFLVLGAKGIGDKGTPDVKPPAGYREYVVADGPYAGTRVFAPDEAVTGQMSESRATPPDPGKGGDTPSTPGNLPGDEPQPLAPGQESQAATGASTQEHVHEGGKVTDAQSPYLGKWDGGGVHGWDGLKAVLDRDGFTLRTVQEDPSTGVRRVAVERVGVDPKTGATVRGTVNKTIYPKTMNASEIDAAGEQAFQSALQAKPGTKLEQPGTKRLKDGSPADGYFEAAIKVGKPPIELRIQGWYETGADGTPIITSHAPTFNKTWPVLDPIDY